MHGHWHHGYDTELTGIDRVETQRVGTLSWGAARVVGLGCDGDATYGWVVLDLPTLAMRWPR